MARKQFIVTATAFDKKGNIIGAGTNSYTKTHPLMKHFAAIAGESEEKIYMHAELAAVLSAGNKQVHKLFVQRYLSNGQPAHAEPCPTCKAMLKAFGVKFTQYTTNV